MHGETVCFVIFAENSLSMEQEKDLKDSIFEAAQPLEEEVVRTCVGGYDLLVSGGTAWVRTEGEWIHLKPILDAVFEKDGE